ncbi:MAG TPA: ferredoxin, partial [Methylibium sp.]|nr:ferredoxin [Methylibium sp.]
DRRPACVMACPTSARLFGDVHDPESEVSTAIRERGGYQLMPEWGTQPSNHYLPRRKTVINIRADQLDRIDSPEKIDVAPRSDRATLDDAVNFSG